MAKPLPDTLRYASGEMACVGDHVLDDVWTAVVEEVITSPEDMARWSVHEAGLMLKTEAAGLVFEPCSSIAWDAIVLVGRAN
ncbi:MAG TPA: hypothetical protein VGX78_18345 [Pirellulales bacterium]|jgi:hypothetical protein|nr:hypothetical protein [Pirellulales bacterium]